MRKEITPQSLAAVESVLSQVLADTNYQQIRRMGGLTNQTYHVTMSGGEEYVVRLPGEGTEAMINREHERVSTQLAVDLGVDAPMLHFGKDGTKVTRYIPNAITMSAGTIGSEEHLRQVAEIFRTLHGCGRDTGVPFEVFDMAASYEKIIEDLHVDMFDDYASIKLQVMQIKAWVDNRFDIPKVPCHNDPLCENWVEGDGRMYLIDWEYAGMNDGMWDIADVSIEAGLDAAADELLLKHYLGHTPDNDRMLHFCASKIYVDYLWTLWAKTRVPFDGQPMEDWAVERYSRMKENIQKFTTLRGQ